MKRPHQEPRALGNAATWSRGAFKSKVAEFFLPGHWLARRPCPFKPLFFNKWEIPFKNVNYQKEAGRFFLHGHVLAVWGWDGAVHTGIADPKTGWFPGAFPFRRQSRGLQCLVYDLAFWMALWASLSLGLWVFYMKLLLGRTSSFPRHMPSYVYSHAASRQALQFGAGRVLLRRVSARTLRRKSSLDGHSDPIFSKNEQTL